MRADLFGVSFWRACRGVMPQMILVLSLGAAAQAQTALMFATSQIASDTGILQVLTADFNGDGNPDLVFLQVFRITVELGNGDGTFRPPIHTPVTATPYLSSMAVGDFNGDGKVDVAVVGSNAEGSFLETYLGNGDGTFSPPVASPEASSAIGNFPLTGDVNHDGNLDLIGFGIIALGAGDGTFPWTISASNCLPATPAGGFSSGPSDFTIGDFRGNGDLDYAFVTSVVVQGGFGTVSATGTVCAGAGNGTFEPGPNIYFGSALATGGFSMAEFLLNTGDFNGDGKADVLVLDVAPGSFSYATILGNGDGTFQPQLSSASIGYTALSSGFLPKPAIADLNGDGKSDVIQIAGNLGVLVLFSSGDGTYRQAAAITPGVQPVSLAVADFNHDGLPDIVSTTANVTSVSLNATRRIDAVVNAASLEADRPVAPGSLVSIFGAGIGPAPALANSGGSLSDSMGGVSVAFNGIPAPLAFVSSRQINAQVPWEVSGEAEVVVTFNTVPTPPFRVATVPIAPGVFQIAGQALAFHSDGSIAGPSGTVAGVPSYPALAGETLTILANGLGPLSPAAEDGAASGGTAGSTPVFIGGVHCRVLSAGGSGSVGVNQLEVVVPEGVHGVAPLQINAGGIITSAKITIAVE